MSQSNARAFFEALVARVRDLPDVRYLSMPGSGRDVYAFIADRDDELCLTLFERQDEVAASLGWAAPCLHVVYLAERELDDFLRPRPELTFSRA